MMRWNKSDKSDPGVEHHIETSASEEQGSQQTLSDVLLDEGKISEEQLQHALKKQEESGKFLGEILIDEGLIDENSLISFLAKQCKIPHLSLLDYLIDQDIVSLIPEEVCMKYRLLPIDKLGRNLTVAMVNPLDREAMEKVREHCPDLRIKPILCAHKHFDAVTRKVFEDGGGERKQHELTASSLGLQVDKPQAKPAETKTPAETPAKAPEKKKSELDDSGIRPRAAVKPVAGRLGRRRSAQAATPASAEVEQKQDAMLGSVFHPKEQPTLEPTKTETKEEPPKAKEAAAAEGGSLFGGGAADIMKDMAAVMMDSMRETYAMLARRMELFNGVDSEEVARLFSKGITEEFEEGEVIFQKGDTGDTLFLILSGEVQIVDGDQLLATLERGDMFGEMALVTEAPRSASAVAAAPSSLLILSLDTIKHTMAPEVSLQLLINIIVTLSDRLRRANERLQQSGQA